ncbi:protein RESISTANCE TO PHYTOPHTHORA 1, chloroplastic [Hevea brasiliensis]|uniref:protein RESISTANCE TO PHYTOPHTHORA 1, chloroplastic n=1 Tax=Hevea brasiliensis TaxID=3981 RepID=UPI0025D34B6F|nr:protein RESISTANCE TO PHYTOPHTHORA 1, chloroplastic [Hevea brasiliensis]
MNSLISSSLCNYYISKVPLTPTRLVYRHSFCNTQLLSTKKLKISAKANEVDTQTTVEESEQELKLEEPNNETSKASAPALDKDLKKAVQKTAATFAPRASTATKNPAAPGTALYTVFEVQGYVSMLLGGALSFNLIFPSNEPDVWRLMGMWSIWMFTIPSLRARDCSKNEKEALNYLFLLIPLLNVIIPFFWKSFAVVWSADTLAFFGMYAWKFGWLQRKE